jgi:hypothetical protein
MRTAPPPRRPLALALAAGLAALGGLAACSPDPQGGAGDAPIAAVETEPWTILNNVDGFPNIATRCRGTTGIYVTRSADDSSDTMEVLPNDPACTETGGAPTGTSVPR